MIRLTKSHSINKRSYYIFLCECGCEVVKRADSTGNHCNGEFCTFSTIHNYTNYDDRLYAIWEGINSRTKGSSKSNCYYKDKGIKLCNDWQLYANFHLWAFANGYKDHLTIDRLNINGNYEPNNCEWVTRSENTKRQNKDHHSNEVPIMVNGVYYHSLKSASKWLIVQDNLSNLKLKTIEIYVTDIVKRNKENKVSLLYRVELAQKEGIKS